MTKRNIISALFTTPNSKKAAELEWEKMQRKADTQARDMTTPGTSAKRRRSKH